MILSIVIRALASMILTQSTVLPVITTTTSAQQNNSATLACTTLSILFANQTTFPGSSTYAVANTFYSIGCRLSPGCIFLPSSANDISTALTILKKSKTPFAVKAGGHMPNPGFNNIGGEGVLIALERMKRMEWVDDVYGTGKKVLKVEPGLRWGEVYEFVQRESPGMMVVGGRVPEVGVAGMLLGCGLSFISAKYGLACDNVVEYELILPNASIITVDFSEHASLFKALKGGSSNFGIVSSFSLLAHDIGNETWGATLGGSYSNVTRAQYLDAVADFHVNGSLDNNAGLLPEIVLIPALNLSIHRTFMWHLKVPVDGAVPDVFRGILGVDGQVVSFMGAQNMSGAAAAAGTGVVEDADRVTFHAGTLVATHSSIHAATHFFESEVSKLTSIEKLLVTITFQPIPASLIEAGRNGNVLGLDASKAPFTWVIHTVSWAKEKDTHRALEAQKEIAKGYNEWAKKEGLDYGYLYLNDADGGQDVFRGYGEENLRVLRDVQKAYDPEGILDELMPGGYKV